MPILTTYLHAVYWVGTLIVLLASLIHTGRRAQSPVSRRQLYTVFYGFAVGFIVPVLGKSAALLFHISLPLEFASPLTRLLSLSITYAILRYNLFDVSAIVRRALIYGILTGSIVLAYLVLVWLFN